MSFQPIVPLSGYAGWRFLERTMERQQQSFEQSPSIQNDTEYFKDKIGEVQSANDLVYDYKLLRTALGAFGLEDQVGSKYLILKVLEEDPSDPDALANNLSDKRWLAFANAFAKDGQITTQTQDPNFAEQIIDKYQARSFETAIGEQDENMQLAMTLDRELASLTEQDSTENAKWYSIMGTTDVREVFDTAFGMPSAFAALDLDRQLEVYKAKAKAMFGSDSVSQFSDPAKRDTLIQNFLIRSQINDYQISSSGQIALQLLGVSQRS